MRRLGRRRRRARRTRPRRSSRTRSCPGSVRLRRRPTEPGAVALVLGPADGAPAVLQVPGDAARCPVLDRYRADGGAATGDPYDPRLFREEVYLPSHVSGRKDGGRRPPRRARLQWRRGRSPTRTASWRRCSRSASVPRRRSRCPSRPSSETPVPPPALLGLVPSLAEAGVGRSHRLRRRHGDVGRRSRWTTRSPALTDSMSRLGGRAQGHVPRSRAGAGPDRADDRPGADGAAAGWGRVRPRESRDARALRCAMSHVRDDLHSAVGAPDLHRLRRRRPRSGAARATGDRCRPSS